MVRCASPSDQWWFCSFLRTFIIFMINEMSPLSAFKHKHKEHIHWKRENREDLKLISQHEVPWNIYSKPINNGFWLERKNRSTKINAVSRIQKEKVFRQNIPRTDRREFWIPSLRKKVVRKYSNQITNSIRQNAKCRRVSM